MKDTASILDRILFMALYLFNLDGTPSKHLILDIARQKERGVDTQTPSCPANRLNCHHLSLADS